MKKIILITVFLTFTRFFGCAQSADEVTKLLNTEEVTYGQACYFLATLHGLVDEDASYGQALDSIKEQGLLNFDVPKFDPIPLNQISHICVKLWRIKGSFFYLICPTPRYAFRLLKAHSVLSRTADPLKKVSGHEFLNILTDCIAKYSTENSEK